MAWFTRGQMLPAYLYMSKITAVLSNVISNIAQPACWLPAHSHAVEVRAGTVDWKWIIENGRKLIPSSLFISPRVNCWLIDKEFVLSLSQPHISFGTDRLQSTYWHPAGITCDTLVIAAACWTCSRWTSLGETFTQKLLNSFILETGLASAKHLLSVYYVFWELVCVLYAAKCTKVTL